MKILLSTIALILALAASALGQSGTPCMVKPANGAFSWLGSCDFPDDDSYFKCYGTVTSAVACYLATAPIDGVYDENGDPIEDDTTPIFTLLASASIEIVRGDTNEAVFVVRASYDPAIIDDDYLNGKGGCTSQNGCTLNAPIVVGSGGGFENDDGDELTLGDCKTIKLTGYSMNDGLEYFPWSGGASVGDDAASQKEAESWGPYCPGGLAAVGVVPLLASTGVQTALPASATLQFGVTVDETNGSALATWTSADGAGGSIDTTVGAVSVTFSNQSGLWLSCTGTCSNTDDYHFSLTACCR